MSGACQIGINGNSLWIPLTMQSIASVAMLSGMCTCSRHRLAGIEEPVNKTRHETKMHT